MRSSTLKALVVHTAREAGYKGPDYEFGYGILNIEKAAKVIINEGLITSIQENELQNSQTYTYQITAGGTLPIEATLAWIDPVALYLINDLDLRIVSTNSNELPWKLDDLNLSGPAVKGDNTKDNLEKIQIENPVPGQTYTVTVTHKGTLQGGSQKFSLIVSGFSNCATASPTTQTITLPVLANEILLKHANVNVMASNIVNASSQAKYVGGQEVVLTNNFDALNGSIFDALIGDCVDASLNKTNRYNPIDRDVIVFDNATGEPKKLQKPEPIIYPNPSKGKFTVNPKDIGKGKYEVLDNNGSLVRNGIVDDTKEFIIDLTNKPNGIYYLLMNTEHGVYTKKLNLLK